MNNNNSNINTNTNTYVSIINSLIGIIGGIVATISIVVSAVGIPTGFQKYIIWLFGISVGFLVLSVSVYVILRNKKNKEQKELYIEDCLDNDYFRNYWIDRCTEPYVGIDCSQTENNSDRKSLKMVFVKDFFRKMHRGTKYAVILGMTGSGKTMAMVNLLMEHVNCKPNGNRSYDIRLFSMRNKSLWEDINNSIDLPKRRKCILLLDALDENEEAQKEQGKGQIKAYMKDLKEKTKDFARVVVSCRTQFFMSLEDEPGETEGVWNKHYLAPFSKNQVNNYLSKKFGVPSNDAKCEKARQIVFSCQEEFCRPLILSWIDELVDKVKILPGERLSLKDIYTYITNSWLNREAFNNDENIVDETNRAELERYSLCMADYLYKNSLSEINDEAYKGFINEYKIQDTDGIFRERSLLSRDKTGYQFTHRSFYEFFLAKIFFQEPNKIQSLQGLDFCVKIFDEFVNDFQNRESDNEEKYRVAKALEKVGMEYCIMHQYDFAEAKLLLALEIGHELLKYGADEYKYLVTTTLNDLANLHNEQHHYEKAETNFNEALVILRDFAGCNTEEYLLYLASTLNNIAILHYHTCKYKDSEREYREALTVVHGLSNHNDGNFQYLESIILNNYANLHRDTRRYKRARREYKKAMIIRRQLAEQNPSVFLPNVAQTLNDLAILNRATHRYNEAENRYKEALDIFQKLSKDKPDECKPYIATIMNNRGNLYKEQGKNTEAEADYKSARDIRIQLTERDPDAYSPCLAMTLKSLATLHRDMGYYDVAINESLNALSNQPTDSDTAIIWNNYAALYLFKDMARTLKNMKKQYSDLGLKYNAQKTEEKILGMYNNIPNMNSHAYYEDVDDVIHLFNYTRRTS